MQRVTLHYRRVSHEGCLRLWRHCLATWDGAGKVCCVSRCMYHHVLRCSATWDGGRWKLGIHDCEKVARGVVAKFGFDPYGDNLSSVDSGGPCRRTCGVLVRLTSGALTSQAACT